MLENSNGVLRITAINCQDHQTCSGLASCGNTVQRCVAVAEAGAWGSVETVAFLCKFSQTESNISSCFPSMNRGDI